MTSRETRTEALVGLIVVLVAIAFVLFAWQRTGGGEAGGTRVTALFPSANGIAVGTDVRVAGQKVGTVAAHRLDPTSFQAELTLALQEGLRMPADSSAAITAESLLGGSYVSLTPGGATEFLKTGDVIVDTQGAVDMMGLIGGVINRSGETPAAAASTPTPEPSVTSMEEEAAATAETEDAAAR